MSSILFIDLEVENHEYYGSTATPYCPDNYIVEAGWRVDRARADGTTDVGPVESVRFGGLREFTQALPTDWLKIPEDCWLIVAHNAAYEISWFLSKARDEFEAFLKRGGRVWDTYHAEYILSDQTSLYPSLDETAPKYGGTHKVDGIKILWEQGVLTSEIDPMLLHEYLCGPGGDVENTAKVFYGQYAAAQEQGKLALLWERMDAVLAFAYCEFFGLWVNMPVAQQNQAEQEARIVELRQQLKQFLPELPETLEFNYGSDYHMSALVYGGSVKYRKRVPYDPPQFVKGDFWKVDGELVPDSGVAPAGAETFKAGKNRGLPKLFREDTAEQKLKWQDDLFKFSGLVDINNMPQVLREKYGDHGEFRGARNLPCGTPVYSTSTDAMKGIAKWLESTSST